MDAKQGTEGETMSKDTLTYPIHHLDFTPNEWAHYNEMRAAKESNDLTDVMKLQAKLSPGEFARIGGRVQDPGFRVWRGLACPHGPDDEDEGLEERVGGADSHGG
jgi:hypothetical protein